MNGQTDKVNNIEDVQLMNMQSIIYQLIKIIKSIFLYDGLKNQKIMHWMLTDTRNLYQKICHLTDFDWTPRPTQTRYSYKISSCRLIFTKLKIS